MNHNFWNNEKNWKKLFEFLSLGSRKKSNSIPSADKIIEKKNFFKDILKSINKNNLQSPTIKQEEKISVDNILEEFNFYMINVGVKNEIAINLLLEISQE